MLWIKIDEGVKVYLGELVVFSFIFFFCGLVKFIILLYLKDFNLIFFGWGFSLMFILLVDKRD